MRTSGKSCKVLGLKDPGSTIVGSFVESAVIWSSLSFWVLEFSLVFPVLFSQYTRNLLWFCYQFISISMIPKCTHKGIKAVKKMI